ncbi:F0F1 ATP synthase subunit B [Eupransor demetentiae]|uniref:ATP synthase subunit b n=1 Tax=Eupransor demetentiae TaxID=3109584 RepID=A0ABP0ERZ6_9LACO|nr:FoF1-type ATP synthase [Lactobacillaceae bacterium LMG 33000]
MLGTTVLTAEKTTGPLALGNMLFIIIAFLILMVILYFVAYGPLTKVLDQRAEKVTSDLDGAEQSRQQAEKLASQREEELKETRRQASDVVAKAQASARQQSDTLLAQANDRAATIGKQAEEDASKMKEDAIAGAKNDVASLSVAIASKLMQKELSVDDQKALINAYIADLDHK